MDALINANRFGQELLIPFKPIARREVNFIAGILIDLFYGFALAGIFLLISPSLICESYLLRGLLYGLIIWFFRVLMSVLSQWMMFDIPIRTLLYLAITGLAEMLLLGLVYGAFLRP
jgi:hypothetical protein